MAEESDKTHRLLFGFASMVENLIRLCLPGPWIERFDFSTLEPVSERLLTEEGDVRRDGDLFCASSTSRRKASRGGPGGASDGVL